MFLLLQSVVPGPPGRKGNPGIDVSQMTCVTTCHVSYTYHPFPHYRGPLDLMGFPVLMGPLEMMGNLVPLVRMERMAIMAVMVNPVLKVPQD